MKFKIFSIAAFVMLFYYSSISCTKMERKLNRVEPGFGIINLNSEQEKLYIKDFSFLKSDGIIGVDINHGNAGTQGIITVIVEAGKITIPPTPTIELYHPKDAKFSPAASPLQDEQIYTVYLNNDSSKIKNYKVIIRELSAVLAEEVSLQIKSFTFTYPLPTSNPADVIAVEINQGSVGGDGSVTVTIQEGRLALLSLPTIILYNPTEAEINTPIAELRNGQTYTVVLKKNNSKKKTYKIIVKQLPAALAQEVSLQIKSFTFDPTAGVIGVDINQTTGIIKVSIQEDKISSGPTPIIELYNPYAAEINPISTALIDGQTYTIFLKDDNAKNKIYTIELIKVNTALIDEVNTYIRSFTVNGVNAEEIDHGDGTNGKIKLVISDNLLISTVLTIILFNETGATWTSSSSSSSVNDKDTYTVTHTASGKTRIYTLNIIKVKDEDTHILNYTMPKQIGTTILNHGTGSDGIIELTIESGNLQIPNVSINTTSADIQQPVGIPQNGSTYIVTHKTTKAPRVYTLKLTIIENTDTQIKSFDPQQTASKVTITHGATAADGGEVKITIKNATTFTLAPKIIAYDASATISPFTTTQDGSFTVTNKGVTRTYKVTIIKLPPTDCAIFDAADLDNIRNPPFNAEVCTLYKDIQLTGEWIPIPSFTGTLDGKGFTIGGLTINSMKTVNDIGFFEVLGGTVKNLSIYNATVRSSASPKKDNVGILAGTIESTGQIENVAIINSLVEGDRYVGGLVGFLDTGGKITNSYFWGFVIGNTGYIGGLVGRDNRTPPSLNVTASYFSNNLTANGDGTPININAVTSLFSGWDPKIWHFVPGQWPTLIEQ